MCLLLAGKFARVNAQAASARWFPWLQLARVTNLPTAWADVLAGYLLLGQPEETSHWIAWALLLAASSALYTAGMVLNDVADVEEDRRQRPERPIPSGHIPWQTARGVGWALLALGAGMAFLAGALQGTWRPGLVALALAGLVVAYDFGLKRLWLGPLALGGCRALNLLLGASVWALDAPAALAVAGALGLYVAGLSWFARQEAAERIPRAGLALGWLLVLAGFAAVAWYPRWTGVQTVLAPEMFARWQLLVMVLALVVSWRCFRALLAPHPLHVQLAVGQMLLSIIVFDAAAVVPLAGPRWAMVLLALLVPAVLLRRWSRPT